MKIRDILSPYKWKFCFTLSLILLEAALDVLFPLAIGLAIDGAVTGEYRGTMLLVLLGLASLLIGAGRRFFDSRFYAAVYRKLGGEIIAKIKPNATSLKTARLGMIGEGVEFLENILPALIHASIGLIGIMIMIAALNLSVFWGCVVATLLVFLLYYLTRNKTIFFNEQYNNELERQVDIINQNDKGQLTQHLQRVMKWNIKLSDLEMVNFSVSWFVLLAFLVGAIVIATSSAVVEYGILFSLIMYVFQYMESVIALPHFYQNWLRLAEIKGRLEEL